MSKQALQIFLVIITTILAYLNPAWSAETLTWQDCLMEAAKNHPDLISAKEEVVQQEESKIIIGTVGLPFVAADFNASTGHSNVSGSSTNFNYGVSGTQLLFDGFKTASNIRSASESVKAAQSNFKFTSSTVRFRLRQGFINLLKAQQSLALTEEIYKLRQNNLDLISIRYQSGTEHKGALLTAQANLSDAGFEINQAKRSIDVARRQLLKEMGRTEYAEINAEGNFEVNDRAVEKPDFEALVQKNPELLTAAFEKNAAAFDIKSSRADYWPEVSLSGDLSRSDSRFPPEERGSGAGVRVSVPLFDAGDRKARLAQSKSVFRQREQDERSTKDELIVGLEESWGDLQDAVEEVQVELDFLQAVEERARISQQQYSVGLISFDNWTIIEDDLVRNKKSVLDSQANALIAEARWIQAKGETLEYENQ